MKRKILYLLVVLFSAVSVMAVENVTNVKARQDKKNIIITYDLAKMCDITIYYASGTSENFRILTQVTGDVGEKISRGTDKKIVWSPLDEFGRSFVQENVRFKVVGVDQKTKRKNNTWYYGSDDHPDHYLEGVYGLTMPAMGSHSSSDFSHYVGLRYAWIPKRFGFEIAPMYGITDQEFSATVGPTFRLTDFSSPLSLQLSFGGGVMHRFSDSYTTWAADASLRFGFGEGISNFGWYSFGLGVRYQDGAFIPNASLSFMPFRWIGLGIIELEDFPQIYTEFMMGYAFKQKDWMFGGSVAYIPGHIGIGGTFLYGIKKDWGALGDVVIRLTPDWIDMDLQIYQGFGYAKLNGPESGAFAMETGIRMAFGEELPYWGLWSFNIGCMYDLDRNPAITFGVSIPIAFVVGTAGMAVPLFL